MKLRDIFNQIRDKATELAALYENSEWNQLTEAKKGLKEFIASIGGNFIGSGCYSEAFKLDMPWGAVVVKFSACGVKEPTQEQLERYPLLRKHYLRPLFQSPNVVVQPLADMSESHVIEDLLGELFRGAYGTGFDSHAGNVGEYRGRMVNFDPLVW